MSQLVTQTTTYGLNSDQYSISTLSSVGGVLEIMAGNPHDEATAPTPIVDFKSDKSVTFYGVADLSNGVTLPQKIIGTNQLADKSVTSGKIADNVTIVGTLTGTASKATADGEGNNIVNTYATKAALTTVENKLPTYATKASPTFTGTVTIPTPSTSDNSTKAASTAFVKAQGYITNSVMQSNLANYLPLTGGTVSGNVTVNGATTHNGESYFYGNPNYTNEAGHIFGIDNTDLKHLGMYGCGANAGGFEAFAEDSPNNARGFNCKARGTNGEHYNLTGRSDGTLQWAGRHVVRSVNGTVAGTDGNVSISIPSVNAFLPNYSSYVTIGAGDYTPPSNGWLRLQLTANTSLMFISF